MTARPVVVVTRRLPEPVHEALTREFDAHLNPEDRPLTPDGLRDSLRNADALLTTVTDKVTADVLSVEPRRARLVANFGVGYDNVDVAACSGRGVVVTNTPDVLTDATADVAFGLMLAAARRFAEGAMAARANRCGSTC